MKKMIVMVALLATATAFGGEIRTERLTNNLWRVRMSRDGKWPESALNRYGIIETFRPCETTSSLDFGLMKASAKQVGTGFELKFTLAEDDRIYGLGDVSRDNLNRRGGAYDIWVKNVISYIPIPMVMTSGGWGVLVNTTYRHTFDVGKSDTGAITVTAKKGDVDFYVFKGRDYRDMLDVYTRLTGRPALLPAFAFGFAYVANEWINMFQLTDEACRFRQHELPCDIIGLEPGWMEYHYDFTTKKSWNRSRFWFPGWAKVSDHRATWIGALKEMNFKLSLWLCQNYDIIWFEEDCAAGRAANTPAKAEPDGKKDTVDDVWFDERVEGKFASQPQEEKSLRKLRTEVAKARYNTVARPDGMQGKDQDGSQEPWFEHLKKFVDRGVRCFKLDASEQVHEFPGRVYGGKLTHDEAHNLYSTVYDKQMADGYEAYTGKRAMVYSPAGYVGVQRYVATWAGDTGGGFKPLISALNLGMSGHPNQSCDMNTYASDSIHFGVFAPWSQQNNWAYFRQLWYREKTMLDLFRNYINLRYRLFPYLYGAASISSRTGWPIMRPLAFVYPDKKEYADECGTYMIGDNLLVSAFVEYVKIPDGKWYEWRSGEEVKGPKTLPFAKTDEWGGALYVKAGGIIPMWPLKQHLERGWNDQVIFHVYLGDNGEAEWYEDDGDSLDYRKGAFTTAALSLKDGTFTIGRRRGMFTDMPAKHDVTVVWHHGSKTKTARLGQIRADVETSVSAPWFWFWE
ncbi:MAG: glycoside hydrolase family 31 protein [Kiritimatiellae bacterium]|nr:glycoside hydrolase family 31 protein [Kiritimatiellia bacterium]MDD3543799.1 glycoside hydrolase family 31 protein [Kiritimatiellia bacterium]MDD4621946.1 glycoside hydrolase family 31 protein [Kiritimatiellia bacterium]